MTSAPWSSRSGLQVSTFPFPLTPTDFRALLPRLGRREPSGHPRCCLPDAQVQCCSFYTPSLAICVSHRARGPAVAYPRAHNSHTGCQQEAWDAACGGGTRSGLAPSCSPGSSCYSRPVRLLCEHSGCRLPEVLGAPYKACASRFLDQHDKERNGWPR